MALENHLALADDLELEESEEPVHITSLVREDPVTYQADGDPALLLPPDPADVPTAPEARTGAPLFVLTNRLNPFALAARVLVNMTARKGAPDVVTFVEVATTAARDVGMKLRIEDRAQNRRGDKRSVAWPIGDDEAKTRDRFAVSFLLPTPPSNGAGPLAELGIATVTENGRVLPTQRGVALAAAPSAILGEAPGWTLSQQQQEILRASVLEMPGESAEIWFFLDAVRAAKGHQGRVERALMKRHPDWTANHVTAHRAAMIGRLRDLDIVTVKGMGSSAVISMTSEGEALNRNGNEEAV